jgi:Preprotein translocase subunit Sec66
LKLPAEVDEYYDIKEKCEAAGWRAGEGSGSSPQEQQAAATGPGRILAQALMKRAIADIPIVTHIQKESAGMNKLYSQSMCSVKQWRSYQAAEAMVSSEVEEVRTEADQVEPGWSQVIWRQAMQYHNMLKQKHEMEQKAAEEQAAKRKEIEQRVAEAKKIMSEEEKAKAAEKAAQELIQAEEQEKTGTSGGGGGSKKSSKGAGAGGGSASMKKGFLDGKGKKKK